MINHKMITKGALLTLLSLVGVSILGNSANAQVEIFYDQEAKSAGVTSLMSSVSEGDLEGVKFFSKSNSKTINQRNLGGATALHIACRTKNLRIAQVLIDAGADVNIADVEGWTPLMRASLAKDYNIVSLLLSSGAKVNVLNAFKESAIIHASSSDCAECLELLLLKAKQVKKSDMKFLKKQMNEAFIIAKNHDNSIIQDIIATRLDYIIQEKINAANIVKIAEQKSIDEEKSVETELILQDISPEKIVTLSLEDKEETSEQSVVPVIAVVEPVVAENEEAIAAENKDLPIEAEKIVDFVIDDVVEKDIPIIAVEEIPSEKVKKFKLTKGLSMIKHDPVISEPASIVEAEEVEVEEPKKVVKKSKIYHFSPQDEEDFEPYYDLEESDELEDDKSGFFSFLNIFSKKEEAVTTESHHHEEIAEENVVKKKPKKFKLRVGKK